MEDLIYFATRNIVHILKPALVLVGKTGSIVQRGMGETMAKSLKFMFEFPPIHGVFDMGYGIVYIFGGMHESEIEDIIVHETVHYVLLKLAGKRTSLKLDNVYKQVDC